MQCIPWINLSVFSSVAVFVTQSAAIVVVIAIFVFDMTVASSVLHITAVVVRADHMIRFVDVSLAQTLVSLVRMATVDWQ